jgi:hypothetical protein
MGVGWVGVSKLVRVASNWFRLAVTIIVLLLNGQTKIRSNLDMSRTRTRRVCTYVGEKGFYFCFFPSWTERQGCQIFLGTTYQNMGENISNNQTIYQITKQHNNMTVKWQNGSKIFQIARNIPIFAFQLVYIGIPKLGFLAWIYTQIGIIGMKIHSIWQPRNWEEFRFPFLYRHRHKKAWLPSPGSLHCRAGNWNR